MGLSLLTRSFKATSTAHILTSSADRVAPIDATVAVRYVLMIPEQHEPPAACNNQLVVQYSGDWDIFKLTFPNAQYKPYKAGTIKPRHDRKSVGPGLNKHTQR